MSRRKAILALVLLVPAPSIGALCGMVIFPDSLAGVLLFTFSKAWLLALPIVWLKLVDREPIGFSPPRKGGFAMGLLSGVGISTVIAAVYLTLGDSLIDREFLVDKLSAVGLASRGIYIGAAAYWILVNSVLEEYVWRWFCVKQCERLLRPTAAIGCSALLFTLHHVIALRVYFGWPTVIVCSLGVFLGGTIWSAMYIRYRSIWPAYLSHAIVDLCVFTIGAAILFNGQ
jgi:membrane protease YdiL (CAAX protease family)